MHTGVSISQGQEEAADGQQAREPTLLCAATFGHSPT